jgi:hypothetical protein
MVTTALILTAVGAGIGAYSSYQSGKSQEIMANMNAAQQERNARTQLISMQTQANLQKQQAEAEFYARSVESQARMNNATTIENQQLGQDAINRVNLRKRREEAAQVQSTQRANIAASGLVESTGTPLDVLAETAETIQRDQEEQAYGFELQRRTIFREAQLERLGGQMALAGATLDRNSGLAAASLNQAAAGAEYRGNMRAAQITRAGGAYARQAGNIGAAATLFSGLGSAAGMYSRAPTGDIAGRTASQWFRAS